MLIVLIQGFGISNQAVNDMLRHLSYTKTIENTTHRSFVHVQLSSLSFTEDMGILVRVIHSLEMAAVNDCWRSLLDVVLI